MSVQPNPSTDMNWKFRCDLRSANDLRLCPCCQVYSEFLHSSQSRHLTPIHCSSGIFGFDCRCNWREPVLVRFTGRCTVQLSPRFGLVCGVWICHGVSLLSSNHSTAAARSGVLARNPMEESRSLAGSRKTTAQQEGSTATYAYAGIR